MKIAEAMKIIDQKWVEKEAGFRVQFKRYTGSEWVADISPPADAAALDSDVTTWRLAWKLAESTPLTDEAPPGGRHGRNSGRGPKRRPCRKLHYRRKGCL